MRASTLLLVAALLTQSAYAQTVTNVAGPTMSFKWNADTLDVNGNPIVGPVTYNIYQGACNANATLAKVQSGITGLSAVISAGITPGVVYGFKLSSTTAVGESALTGLICVSIPAPKIAAGLPATPTGFALINAPLS